MTHFLDLRNKVSPQIKIIYKTVTQRRPWYLELAKISVVIAFVGTVVWGVSNADTIDVPRVGQENKNWSAIGYVSEISADTLSLEGAHGTDNASTTEYQIPTDTLEKIETSKYIPLQLFEVSVGSKVIVQGVVEGELISARRLIVFLSASTATSTLPVTETASTTATASPDIASSTDDTASSTSTTTPSFIENVIDAVSDIVQNIIDVVTGTTTGTSTEEIITPTTTPEIIPMVEESVSSSTEPEQPVDTPQE